MTRFLLAFTVFAALGSFAAPPAGAQTKRKSSAVATKIDPAKREEVRRYMELTGLIETMDHAVEQSIKFRKLKHPEISETYWIRIREEMKGKDLAELLIPVYDKIFTLEDLKAINAFYLSTAGKKLTDSMPLLKEELKAAAGEWGQELSDKVAKELEKEKADAADQN